ncbi:MAG: metal ABC transporter ATP-binding protein [Verrucomicrobiota bacterium]|nr:metal ABC transporter ATP-binding protein [Verrucomicrobiota bacterium]
MNPLLKPFPSSITAPPDADCPQCRAAQYKGGAPVIEVADAKVSFNGVPVLRGVNLTIPKGEIVAVIGPNGCGKTTLLRSLLGLQRLDAGTIKLFGETDIHSVLHRVGYVPQKLALDRSFALSVREFLALRLPSTRHWFWKGPRSTDTVLAPIVAELAIEKLLPKPLAQLSGGQLQRVLIAFSLLHQPQLLLLDEPTAGVDTPGEQGFYELIGKIHKQHGLTVVLVSHDLSMVYKHATWVYALNGVVCCEGTPEEVMNAESLKQAYGIHVSPYHHHHHVH